MLGRKREAANTKSGSKRRWQQEIDGKAAEDEVVTAEELDEWRQREDEEEEDEAQTQAPTAQRQSVEEEARSRSRSRSRSPSLSDLEAALETGAAARESPAACLQGAATGGSNVDGVLPNVLPPPPLPGWPAHVANSAALAFAGVPLRPREERLVGRVKRFMDVPGGFGYGFIDCEETKLRFTRDVYVHRNQLEGLQIGDEVTFTLMLNSKGEPQARNVMKLEDALLLSSGQAMQTQELHLMDENQAKQFQAALKGSRQ